MSRTDPAKTARDPERRFRRRQARGVAGRLLARGITVFDTVGARVMLLIIATTLPLATISGILAWHSYEQNAGSGGRRTIEDSRLAISEITHDITRTHAILDMLARGGLNSDNAFKEFNLVQSVSQNHFCTLMLTDVSGHPSVILPPPSTQVRAICQSRQPILTNLSPVDGRTSAGTDILVGARGPLVRFVVPVFDDSTLKGFIVAVRTLGWQLAHLQDGDGRLLAGMHDDARHMLMMPNGTLFSMFPERAPPDPIGGEAGTRLRRDAASGILDDLFTDSGTTYVVRSAYGSVSVVVATRRTPAETLALHVFILRVALIVGLLTLELIAVALGARFFVVEPLERLARAVANWRRGGALDSRINRAVPLEIRHLERAFLRATRHLTRHEHNLERSAHNQDMLIREIHHRVKNNLQVIASLINLQASRIRSLEAREEFRLVRDRVRALATLHRYLYSENGLSALDVRSFLQELCTILFAANEMGAQTRVKLVLDIDDVLISPDQAVPLALLVTEVVSNALRYAFPDEREGTIRIALKKSYRDPDVDPVTFVLSDDGVGMAEGRARVETTRRNGIGMQLIRGFARQLNASLDIANGDPAIMKAGAGTTYTMRFVPAPPDRTAVAIAREAIAHLGPRRSGSRSQ